jgi:hypothetical protein
VNPRGRRRAPRSRLPEVLALIVLALLAVGYIWYVSL